MTKEEKNLFTEIYSALLEKGYNAREQLAGFLVTEDPAYITSFNGARAKAGKLNRDALLLDMISCYVENNPKSVSLEKVS